MSANVESKKLIVEEIKAKVMESKSIVFADYNKLTVLEVTALRRKFKEVNCEYKVYKNTLVRKAAKEVGILVAQRALEKGIKNVVFDRGGYLYHGRVAELAEGAREGGLEF